jgi:TolB protein
LRKSNSLLRAFIPRQTLGQAIGLALALTAIVPWPIGVRSIARAFDGSARLAFAAYRHGQWDIYSTDAGGADVRQLTDDTYEDRDPAYSPDGTKLAFASRRDRNWDIYVLDLATGQQTRLTTDPAYDGAPAWSPDGRQLAFESARTGDLDVWSLDVAGGAQRDLTGDSPAGDFAPAWSPDGTRIAFTSWRRDSQDLFVLDVPSGALTQLTDSQAAEAWPAWSPDGHRLAFVRNWLGEREVYLMDVSSDTSGPASQDAPARQVTWLGRADAPAWSPGGDRLALLQRRWDGEQLLALDPAAGVQLPDRLTGVTGVAWLDGRPTWGGAVLNYGTPLSSLADAGPSPLYQENLTPSQSGDGEPWDLVTLTNVKLPTPAMTPYLSDRVNDSFVALRRRLAQEVGYDFLGQLSEAARPYEYASDTSEYASWHKSGRAIDTLFDFNTEAGQVMEIARDDMGGETFWRVYLRCTDQSGTCGRPLTVNTWDYSYTARNKIAPDQGGIERPASGAYYVDFTALAREYGWTRISSWNDEDFGWTWYFTAFEYWHYQKPEDLTWYQAMQEVYAPAKLKETFTYDRMLKEGEHPFLIALKGVPLPADVRLWWSSLRP